MITNSALADKSLELGVAFANAGTIEADNNNRGFQIDRIESVWGLRGLSYCAMGLFWDFAKAYAVLTGVDFDEDSAPHVFAGLRHDIAERYCTFSPSVQEMIDAAGADKIWRPISHGIGNIMHGEFLCYDWNRGHGTAEHHIEQVISVNGTWAKTMGWNTSGGGGLDESTNDPKLGGAHVKMRRLDDGTAIGWIGWRRGE